ncbi:hypothetical protein EGW08_019233 [Elysia chlorotica]|uniref:G-protein coupled receptors family 1 profile domain-containing protein n=1 Tax=Elysia chlorotica TaxID=188477 RepID=A0A433SUM6_ELYCH|nr:hypothetical protein EGW08_019233 [Elysia chlorotica]
MGTAKLGVGSTSKIELESTAGLQNISLLASLNFVGLSLAQDWRAAGKSAKITRALKDCGVNVWRLLQQFFANQRADQLHAMSTDSMNKTGDPLVVSTIMSWPSAMNYSELETGLTTVIALQNVTNTSDMEYDLPPTFTAVMLTRCIIFVIMFVISFIGNVATLVQMRRLRRRKSTINTLIVNLALADLLVTFFCIAGDTAWVITVQWLAGNVMCKFVKYMQVFALYLSTYITVVISLDRCVAILDPMRRNGAAQRVKIMVCFAWIFSALFSIPQSRPVTESRTNKYKEKVSFDARLWFQKTDGIPDV